jgi:hypothetical protein
MGDEQPTLFVMTRDSRVQEVRGDEADTVLKRELEAAFAEQLGVDVDKLRGSEVSTESTCEFTTHMFCVTTTAEPGTTTSKIDEVEDEPRIQTVKDDFDQDQEVDWSGSSGGGEVPA